jgi:hypothetical protein
MNKTLNDEKRNQSRLEYGDEAPLGGREEEIVAGRKREDAADRRLIHAQCLLQLHHGLPDVARHSFHLLNFSIFLF